MTDVRPFKNSHYHNVIKPAFARIKELGWEYHYKPWLEERHCALKHGVMLEADTVPELCEKVENFVPIAERTELIEKGNNFNEPF
ncbi:hypothetical protein V6R21_11640 [Limibacter armeniacum]|uniref:hypothetical protein n=1 Tax=Limibacter armeniacum TaxID=466084 RepID=UPI002FE62E08